MDIHLGSYGERLECRRLRDVSPVPSSPSARPSRGSAGKASPDRQAVAKRASQTVQGNASVDHWTMVLFYALCVGVLALVGFFFVVLMGVGLYGQLVWTFTQWDLSSVRSAAVKPWAHFTLWVVFLAGTSTGVWFFGGYAWKNLNARMSNAATRARR